MLGFFDAIVKRKRALKATADGGRSDGQRVNQAGLSARTGVRRRGQRHHLGQSSVSG